MKPENAPSGGLNGDADVADDPTGFHVHGMTGKVALVAGTVPRDETALGQPSLKIRS
jgi:hypothetical protein